jgi:hypothetical protein
MANNRYEVFVYAIKGKEYIGDWFLMVEGRLAVDWADAVWGVESDGTRTLLKSKHGPVP